MYGVEIVSDRSPADTPPADTPPADMPGPDGRLHDRAMAWIAASGVALIAGWCMYLSLDRSGTPSFYYAYYRAPELYTYPTRDVAQWTAAIAVEAAIASWWLWRARSLPGACAVLALLFGCALVVLAPFGMHAPPYFGAQLGFLFLAVVWFVVAALATWLVRLAKRRAAC